MRSNARRSLALQNTEVQMVRLCNKKSDKKQLSQQIMNTTGRCMETMENFRTHTQMVFKHSVRGEWDVVDALQAYDHMLVTTADIHEGRRRLPSINEQGMSRPGSKQRRSSKLLKVQSLPTLREVDRSADLLKTSSVQQRQRRRPHSQSSQNLRQAGKASRHDGMVGSSDSASMQTGSGLGEAERLKARADRKLATIVQEESDVLGAQPTELLRYGAASFKRFHTMAKVSAKPNNTDPATYESFMYRCQLCMGCHDVSVPCCT